MAFISDNPEIDGIVYSEEQVKARVAQLGAQITKDYAGRDLLLVCVLRGAVMFMTDLARSIDLPLEMDFMAVSSYGSTIQSSGVVRIIKDLDTHIEGRDVLIAEDVLDSGLTLKYLMKSLNSRSPASLEVAALFHKHKSDTVLCKYVGFDCPDAFIVGYGLDYAEKYRNLPYVGILDPKVYSC
jgi:hypoxanthine phosphoribosyltransferase